MSYTLTNTNTVKFAPVGPTATVATFDNKVSQERLAHNTFVPDWGWGMTSAFWLRVQTTATAGEWYHAIGQYGPIWGGGGFILGDGNSQAGLLALSLSNPTVIQTAQNVDTVNDDMWHFVALRYDPSTFKGDISVDMQAPVFTAALTGGHPTVNPTYKLLYYGSAGFLGDVGFQGDFCRAGIWNYYLGAAALAHLYNRGRGRAYADLSSDLNATSSNNRLMAYYDMAEASGSRADSTGTYNLSVEGDGIGSTSYTQPAQIPGQAAGFQALRQERLDHASLFNVLDGTFDYTVVCWYRHPSQSLSPARYVWNFGTANAGPTVYFGASGAETQSQLLQLPSGNTLLGDCRNKWLMVVSQYQASDATLRTMVKGSPSNDGVWTQRINLVTPACTQFAIGRNAQSTIWGQGQVSLFTIFNKQLSEQEILVLWNGGDGYRPFWGVSISPSLSQSPSGSQSPSASPSPSHSLSPSASSSGSPSPSGAGLLTNLTSAWPLS